MPDSASSHVAPDGMRAARKPRWRTGAFWKKQARIWHWMSGALCLIGTLLFAVTGITLNHAAEMEANPVRTEQTIVLDDDVLGRVNASAPESDRGELPGDVARALRAAVGADVSGRTGEWTEYDVYVGMPRAGGDAWLSIDRESGEVIYEVTSRGAVAWLNDLHKGRNTGVVWSWFIDIFAGACVIFCLTGLWLLQIHSGKRAITWPLTIAGLAIPAILAVFFLHG